MDKLTLAHQMAIAIQSSEPMTDMVLLSSLCFGYADAMFAEAEKREKEESAKRRAEIREILNSNSTFIEREGQHFDDVNWQPDWSLAPDNAVACAMDACGYMWWYEVIPERYECIWIGLVIGWYENHNYTGDWRNSLRIRPSSSK